MEASRMTTKTIERVLDEYSTWEGKKGTLAFVKVHFADGDHGDLGCKPENAQARIETLKALIDVPSEFGLEAKDDYQGIPQWKIVDWPGKQPYGGGSGGRDYTPAWSNTEEGQRYAERLKNRRTALMQAVTDSPGVAASAVLRKAEMFDDWLKDVEATGVGTTESVTGGVSDPAPEDVGG